MEFKIKEIDGFWWCIRVEDHTEKEVISKSRFWPVVIKELSEWMKIHAYD